MHLLNRSFNQRCDECNKLTEVSMYIDVRSYVSDEGCKNSTRSIDQFQLLAS